MTGNPTGAPRVSIIIPNWNGLKLLRPCLDSLRQQTFTDLEIIVVDNASTDGSVEALQREYPEVRVLALTTNGGYSGGSNAGIRAARGQILVMLNNDTEAEPGWIAALVDALDRHPEAGSAASRIMLYDDRQKLHSAGDYYRRNGLPDSRGVWQTYDAPYNEECFVFGGCGGAVAYRREMLEDIGLFEERFFMYCEDVDLNWKAQLAGWKCVYVPQAVVYHHLSATGGGVLSSYYVGRNTLWVIARNYPTALLRRHWREIVSAQWAIAREALRAWRGAAARARLRGQLVGLFTSVRWLSARKATLSRRRAADAYIESILT
jgi:GT2 family glycosyltransferase